MNKSNVILIAFAISILSCGNNLEKLKKERADLSKEVADLNQKLESIDAEIEKLEPSIEEAILVSSQNMQESIFEHFVDLQSSVKTDQDVIIYPEFAGTLKLYVR